MTRQDKIDFIVDNHPQFDEDVPQECIDDYRRELESYTDEDIEKKLEFVDYLLEK